MTTVHGATHMIDFELAYIELVERTMCTGDVRVTRNGETSSIFGTTLKIKSGGNREFPLLLGRPIYYKGVIGELIAFLRGPKNMSDFKSQGCNYWDKFCDADGAIQLDYGNKWLDFNGVNQLEAVREKLLGDPSDRRMLITSWDPGSLGSLSLPCCHLLYQWYVRDGEYLDMMWYQRSVDVMLGLPSDIVLASLFNIMLANNVGLRPGDITMTFGDTHIYKEHYSGAREYLRRMGVRNAPLIYPTYTINTPLMTPIESMAIGDISIHHYCPAEPAIKMELKV